MLEPFYCTICSIPEEKTLIVHTSGKCPKEQKVHGLNFCPNCGFKLSDSKVLSVDEENK